MQFASVRIITDDVARLAAFYELLLGVAPVKPAPVFAAFAAPGGATLAIGHRQTVAMLDVAEYDTASNHSVLIEFLVDDPDAEHARLKDSIDTWVLEPTTMPWGNRSVLLRDPDGNLVNLYAPLTDVARSRQV